MSDKASRPVALLAADAPARPFGTNYPEPFASRMAGRDKRPLGDLFGLANFGVNITRLAPGAPRPCATRTPGRTSSSISSRGARRSSPTPAATALEPGMCAGFKAGTGDAHHLVNETEADVVYLEIGDRSAGDAVNYPDDDLAVVTIEGQRRAAHKDGTPY